MGAPGLERTRSARSASIKCQRELMTDRDFDILSMGRSSIDLYANDIGAPFPEIKTFAAYVGGCPTTIRARTRRLGMRSVLLTAVGEDPVGDFVLHFLKQ